MIVKKDLAILYQGLPKESLMQQQQMASLSSSYYDDAYFDHILN